MARTKQTARASFGGKGGAKRHRKVLRDDCDDENESQDIDNDEPSIPESAQAKTKVTVEYDVSYESSFYAHYFETGQEFEKVFAPRYAIAKTKKDVDVNDNSVDESDSTDSDYWVSVNFNSKYDGKGIETHNGRPTLNLVIAFDISGSMQQPFQGEERGKSSKSKLDVAKDSLFSIMSVLKPEDSFGLMAFDHKMQVVQPLTKWKDTDRVKLEKGIANLYPRGGTELALALKSSCDMFANFEERPDGSNRIFFMTDMTANYSDDGNQFADLVRKHSDDSIWTTVIGIGMDLHSDIIERVSKTPGANYCNVRSSEGFKELMETEFQFLVTPIGFNISVDFVSDQFELIQGYGSPEVAKLKPGQPLLISTEFPSLQNDKGERRGGALLFKLKKLKKTEHPEKISMSVKYDDLQGLVNSDVQNLEFKEESFYQDGGIREAVLLVKYTEFVRRYLSFRKLRQTSPESTPKIDYKSKLHKFVKFVESEKSELKDPTLQQEIDFLQTILELEPELAQLEETETKPVEEDGLEKMTVAKLKAAIRKRGATPKKGGSKKDFKAQLKELNDATPAKATHSTNESSNNSIVTKEFKFGEPMDLANSDITLKESSETKVETEEEKFNSEVALDLVFVVDCTSSMSSYIKQVQKNITRIVEEIIASEKADVRFALVCYRDYPPQDTTYITEVHDFTPSIQEMKLYVNKMYAAGGGDGPESMATGLLDALELKYRDNATKICILVADAPPHGLGEGGDGFPDGDPGRSDNKTYDPLEITAMMAAKGIILYSVGCEGAISSYNYLASFLVSISKKCGGKYIGLSNASSLSQVIIGGCKEELSLGRISEEVVRIFKEKSETNNNTAGVIEDIVKLFNDKGTTIPTLEFEDAVTANAGYIEIFDQSKTIAEAKSLYTTKPKKSTVHSTAKQASVNIQQKPLTTQQVSKILKRANLISNAPEAKRKADDSGSVTRRSTRRKKVN